MGYNLEKILEEINPDRGPGQLGLVKEIKAGAYLRQSTIDRQNLHSVDEQLEFIKHRLDTNQVHSTLYPKTKIILLDEFIFCDRGETGRVGRKNYNAFKDAIITNQFHIGLVFDLSRLTRELGSLLDTYDLARANRVELIAVAEAASSHMPSARIHFIAKGMTNEMQSESTSRNTRRGLELRALSGKSTGHNPYGFTSIAEDPSRIPKSNEPANRVVVVNHEKAEVVRHIFELYDSSNVGVDGISKILNKENIPSPKGKKWLGRTILGILKNPKYIGVWVHGRTSIVRDGTKDRLKQIPRPRGEWVVKTYEDRRIISQALWERVHDRIKRVDDEKRAARNKPDSIWGKSRGQANHLFTGTMICGGCGGSFIGISGRRGGYFGCRNAYRKGTCSNKRSIRISWVENALIGKLRQFLDEPKTLDYLCRAYNKRVNEGMCAIPDKIGVLEKQLFDVEKSLNNFVEFLGAGNASPAVQEALKKAEKQKSIIEAQLVNLKARQPKGILLTPFAFSGKLDNLDRVLSMDVQMANIHLRKLFTKPIRMIPNEKGRSYFYEAAGEVNLTRLLSYSVPVNGVPNRI